MDDKKYLVVSEKFTSIQGEGQTMGKKAIFLRLAGCNILCKSEHWICDTIEVWQKGVNIHFRDIFTDKEVNALRFGYHLVITGGEPLLHQEKLINFLRWFQGENNFSPTIEVETNGTIMPFQSLLNVVDYWNVSPKLANSGVGNKRRNSEVLRIFNDLHNSIFKFVMSSKDDVFEIISMSLNNNKIYLMPAGSSQEELLVTRPETVEVCLKHAFNYSERLHIVIWNQKTGV